MLTGGRRVTATQPFSASGHAHDRVPLLNARTAASTAFTSSACVYSHARLASARSAQLSSTAQTAVCLDQPRHAADPLKVQHPQPPCLCDAGWQDSLAQLQTCVDARLTQDWICSWLPAVTSSLHHASAAVLVELLTVLSKLPWSSAHRLHYEQPFWDALWADCQARLTAGVDERDSPDPAQLVLLVAAARATRQLYRQGIPAPDIWLRSVLHALLVHLNQPAAANTADPAQDAAAGPVPSAAAREQLPAQTSNAAVLVMVMQTLHHTPVSLSAGDSQCLVSQLISLLPTLTCAQLSKVLPTLPAVLRQLPHSSQRSVQAVVLQAMSATLLQLQTQQTATTSVADMGKVRDAPAGHTACADRPAPIEVWQVSNWLHALSSGWTTGTSEQSAGVTGVVQSPRVLSLLLSVVDPRVLVTASAPDLVSITAALAKMNARLSPLWLGGLLAAASPRMLNTLTPRQLVVLCWALGKVGAGHVASPAWLTCAMSCTHRCMEGVPPHSLGQMAWGVVAMVQQARSSQTSSGWDADSVSALASWLLHLMQASVALSREASARSLASVVHSGVTLMDVWQRTRFTEVGQQKLQEQYASWMQHMLLAFQRRLHHADGHSLSRMITSIGLAMQHSQQHTTATVEAQLGTPSPPGGVSTGACHSSLQHTAGQMVSSCVQQLHQLAAQGLCSTQDLAVSGSALVALWDVVPSAGGLLHRHLQLALDCTAGVPPSADVARDLATLVTAVSRAPACTWRSAPSVSEAAAGTAQVVGLRPQQPQPATMDRLLLGRLILQLPEASAGTVAAAWLSMGRLQQRPDAEQLGTLLLSSHRRMHDMTPAQLGHMVWALGRLGVQPGSRWLDRLQLVVYKQLQHHALSWQTRAVLAWAAGKCGWVLQREFLSALLPGAASLSQLRLVDLSMFGWAMARMKVVPSEAWTMMFLMTTSKCVAQLVVSPAASLADSHTAQPGHDAECPEDEMRSTGAVLANARVDGGWATGGPARGSTAFPGQLLMLGNALTAWRVQAPRWWWSAWFAAMQTMAPVLDLRQCSLALRQLARCQGRSGGSSGAAGTHVLGAEQAQAALVGRALQLLQQAHSAGAHVPLTPCAVILWSLVQSPACEFAPGIASGSGRGREGCGLAVPKLRKQTDTEPAVVGHGVNEGAGDSQSEQVVTQQLVQTLFAATRTRLAQLPPSYLVLMTSAAAKLHGRRRAVGAGGQQGAESRPGTDAVAVHTPGQALVPAAWVQEAAAVLEARNATLSTALQHNAAAALAVLQRTLI